MRDICVEVLDTAQSLKHTASTPHSRPASTSCHRQVEAYDLPASAILKPRARSRTAQIDAEYPMSGPAPDGVSGLEVV